MRFDNQDPIQNVIGGTIVAGGATASAKAVETLDPSAITLFFNYFHIAEIGAILGTLWVFINIMRWGYSLIYSLQQKWTRKKKL